ncbi:HD domain-containing protein [Vibrio mangrovi]|uniref:HD domain-containing protein n=1 Tax=Vibrio mangrovi TaxID=474394 RepID=A0A1Y6IR23_9VIBR|nr:HD domain-containing protein [Vibrio mangrovi]MDW6001888.1 HD domain-containing protein [Vibrio mangrovi]SMS00085.1 putative hydrolase [Vibrio mangrovi]
MNSTLETKLKSIATNSMKDADPSHDMMHVDRVVKNCKYLSQFCQNVDMDVLITAAYLHDVISYPKDSSKNKDASRHSAEYASQLMRDIPEFPEEKMKQLEHVIQAHSYSSQIEAESIEAQILQDADRLDALGAIGIARCFIVGGKFASAISHPSEPNPTINQRPLDDKNYIVDHFYNKLLKLEQKLNTSAAKEIARKRGQFMQDFLNHLYEEIAI